MGLYVNLKTVQTRLTGKVQFTDDPNEENKMSSKVANRLINEAEGQVELDLSPRYMAPFQTDGGSPFDQLPTRPTLEQLRTLCELQAVMRILETDFGQGSAVNGSKYIEIIQKRYDKMVSMLLEKRKDRGVESSGWKYPPLPGLRLNYMNAQGDDGYLGSVLVASGSPSHGYPKGQINNPAENFWNGFPPGWDDATGKCDNDRDDD